MKISDARNLEPGDEVWGMNGRYLQIGQVVSTRPHERSGLWITYRWTKNGKAKTAEKRHVSVYLPGEIEE